MAFPHRATSLGQTWFAKPWISLPTFAGFDFRKILRTLERARLRSGFDFSIFSPWSIWAENTLADCPKFRIHHITEWSANKGSLRLKHLKQSQVMQEFVHRMYVYWRHIGHYWGSHVEIKSLCTSIASWLVHIILCIVYTLHSPRARWMLHEDSRRKVFNVLTHVSCLHRLGKIPILFKKAVICVYIYIYI